MVVKFPNPAPEEAMRPMRESEDEGRRVQTPPSDTGRVKEREEKTARCKELLDHATHDTIFLAFYIVVDVGFLGGSLGQTQYPALHNDHVSKESHGAKESLLHCREDDRNIKESCAPRGPHARR